MPGCNFQVNGFILVLYLKKGIRKLYIPKIPKKTAVRR